MISVTEQKEQITKPAEIEEKLMINKVKYTFAGALLSDGGNHYRAFALVNEDNYLVYDGMWRGDKIKRHARQRTFGRK